MRNNKKILLKLMLVGILFSSCKKYLDVNTDPNRVTDANVTAELILTQTEVTAGARMASGNYIFMDHWVGYSAQNGGFAPQQNEITYNIDKTFGNAIWENHMHLLFDLHQVQVKGLASGDTTAAGAALVLTAKHFQELVDLFGNIPYSQTFSVNTITSPAYDKAEDIYADLQKKLDTAIQYFGATVTSTFAKADVIANGNTTLWIKFANTIKLRLLIRQSQVSGFDPSAEIAKIIANGGPLGAGESIAVNPGYSNDVNKQNPFYSNFGWSPTGVVSTGSDNANNYIISILAGTGDPRLGSFFYPVGFSGNAFAGAVYGDQITNIPPQSGLSYFGPGLVGAVTSDGKGDGSGAVKSQWIMPSFESMFFYAEAVARGWIVDIDSNAYKAAVTESFVWLGVPDAINAAAAYLAGPDGNWSANAGTTADSKAKFIAYQKYIALTMIDPQEAYSDIRRLNMLTDMSYISIAAGNNSAILPVRLLYPQDEYTTNSANVSNEGNINQFTSKIFWTP